MDYIRESRVDQVLNNDMTNKTNKISRAPLHKAWPLARNISDTDLNRLIEEGYKIKRGLFTREEDKRLKRNWSRIERCHPEFADPFLAFGVRSRPYDKEETYKLPSKIEMRDLRRKYAMFGMLFRMAYGLEDRLLCDIYSRCRRLFAYEQFTHTEIDKVPESIKELAEEDLCQNNEPLPLVSYKYNMSPSLVKTIKRQGLKGELKRFRWKPEDDFALKMAIEAQFPDMDAYDIPTHQIDWFDVEKIMRATGYELVQSQLSKRWRYLNPKMVGLRKPPALQD